MSAADRILALPLGPAIQMQGQGGPTVYWYTTTQVRALIAAAAEIARDAERGAARLRWVPVTQRLPEFNTEVLIALDAVAIACTGQCCRVVGRPGEVEWLYPSENHWPGDPAPTVIAWQPLPEHPNVGPDGNFRSAP